VTRDAQREADYRRRVRFARFAMRLVRSAGRKRRGFLDRLLTRLLRRATTPRRPEDDFMRDELVDAAIGFEPDELARWQASGPDPSQRAEARVRTPA
jgi:hypothetical protein